MTKRTAVLAVSTAPQGLTSLPPLIAVPFDLQECTARPLTNKQWPGDYAAPEAGYTGLLSIPGQAETQLHPACGGINPFPDSACEFLPPSSTQKGREKLNLLKGNISLCKYFKQAMKTQQQQIKQLERH